MYVILNTYIKNLCMHIDIHGIYIYKYIFIIYIYKNETYLISNK